MRDREVRDGGRIGKEKRDRKVRYRELRDCAREVRMEK